MSRFMSAVWVLQFTAATAGNASQDPFPELVFLPVLLLVCASAAAAWQARRGSKTA